MATRYIEPTVVRKSLEKGTKAVIGIASDPLGWNGESFVKEELERLELAGDLMIMTAKGTKSVKMSEMPKARPKREFHGRIVINKGTSSKEI